MRLAVRALLAAFLLAQGGCTTLTYVTQAAVGQDDLNRRARSIDDLVKEKRVNARTRRLLSEVAPIKHFGEQHGLAPTNNYRKYVKVDRPAVVWVVSASDPLHFHSRRWSFPLVGSFTYLGWFKKDEAQAFAGRLRGDGLDVDVRGAGAYSTAGYFEDSVLSTMLRDGKEGLGELANVILHESAHATFFVRHQSTLNESVANFVGDKLSELYVEERLGHEADETVAYLAAQRAGDRRGRALRAAYQALDTLYHSKKSDEEKLAEKAALVTQLRAATGFKRPINNATLLQFNTYNSGQEELAALLLVCGGDWPRFIRALKRLESSGLGTTQESDVGKIIGPLVAARCAS